MFKGIDLPHDPALHLIKKESKRKPDENKALDTEIPWYLDFPASRIMRIHFSCLVTIQTKVISYSILNDSRETSWHIFFAIAHSKTMDVH